MKRTALFVIVVLMCITVPVFAGGTADTGTSAAEQLNQIGFHAAGFPIVDQKVTMNILVTRPAHFPTAYKDMITLQEIQEMTNVEFVFTEIPDTQAAEKVNLMFASRDFPEVAWQIGANNNQIYEAGRAGDIWPLGDLIKQYSPNWMKAFQEYPILQKTITFPDGNIYSFPYSRQIENDYGIRDIEAINVDWLEKVGKKMPTTTDEFFDVLMAFRQGIDNGTLPKNGIPYYILYHSTIDGEFPVYGYFGLYIYDAGYLSQDNGKVRFDATNPQVINALEYLHKLYVNNLITEEAFTAVWADYLSVSRSDPPMSGSWGSYFIPELQEPYYDPLPPLKAPGVARPLFRSQQVRIEENKVLVFKKFQYPEVAVRVADIWADDLWAMQLSYGPIGVTIDDNGDGTYTARGVSADYLAYVPHNFTATYISTSMADRIKWTRDQGRREQYVQEIYKPYTWAQEDHFPRVKYTDSELEDLAILQTEVRSYIRSTWANWIVSGGAREGWDDYLKQLNRLELPKLLEIYQAALDRFNAE